LKRTFFACVLVVASLAIVQERAAQAGSSCSSCGQSSTVEAPVQKVVVEVPPPNVIIRACGSSADQGCGVKRCCHFLCRPTCAQPAYAPAYAPAAPMAIQPMAVVPAAPTYAYQQPVAPAVAYQQPVAPFAFSQPVAPTFAYQQPIAAPQTVYVPVMAAPPAAPTAPTPPAASDSGTDANKALQRITAQMETLTKVVEKHTTILTSHEDRIQRMEKWLGDKNNLQNNLPPLKESDK
jgi:hypothetical protein